MSKQLKPIDFITSLVATFLWFTGGVIMLDIVRAIFLAAIPLRIRDANKIALGSLFLLLILAAFILGVWLTVKWLLPLFMSRTHQANSRKTTHLFLALSALSILGLYVGDAVSHKSLLGSYTFWAIALAGIYLFARYKTLG